MTDLQALVQGNTAFAFDLYRRLCGQAGNLFFSPHSLSVALGMTYAGARGATASEIAGGLHFTLSQENIHPAFQALQHSLGAAQGEHVTLREADALWPHIDYRFSDEFVHLLQTCYGASLTPLDYQEPEPARQAINAWVAEKTANQLRDLIPPGMLSPSTRLVLSNAIYFKGDWAEAFEKEMTAPASFWVTPERDVPALTMRIKAEFGYAETDQAQILELPYHGKKLSMLILLPAALDGLAALESMLDAKWMIASLRKTEVELSLPKFKLKCTFQLNDVLRSLGVREAFDPQKANFSGMNPNNMLYISDVVHQAFVDVTEEGAAAAAVTLMAQTLGIPQPPLVFRADHPFLFAIRENNTGSILFMGRVQNPAG